jgi:RNA polymerase sigma factor (sigma-70 family)
VNELARRDDARAAFEQLFRDTRTDLLAYIVRRSQSAEDAADVLAETYLVAWRKLDVIPTGERARLWLFGVARNLLLKGASRRRSCQALVERLAAELRSAHPPHAPVEDERSSALRSALAGLPEFQREIVMLTAWEGLTPKQIAAVTGAPVNIVRVRLHRARTRLKQDLATSLCPSRLAPGTSPPSATDRNRAHLRGLDPPIQQPGLARPISDRRCQRGRATPQESLKELP